MKRLVLPALVLLALCARATVYQPGLWFIHDDTTEQISTLKYPSIAAMDSARGFSANVRYRTFPKLGWHKTQWANMSKNTITNWFEWHHRDEFRAFAETNRQ